MRTERSGPGRFLHTNGEEASSGPDGSRKTSAPGWNVPAHGRIWPRESYLPYELTPAEKVAWWAAGILLGCAAGWLFFRHPAGFLLAFPLGAALRREGGLLKGKRRRLLLTRELREYLLSVLGGLRAGLALENAMRAAGKEVRTICGPDSMMAAEAAVMSSRLDLQIPPEELWREFGERCGLEEARSLGRIFAVAKRQGGDYTPVLRGMADAMEGKLLAREEIQTLLTGKKLEYEIMCAVPAAILLYLNLAGGEMVEPLYTTPAGRVTALAAAVLYAGTVFWGLRILDRAFEAERRMSRQEKQEWAAGEGNDRNEAKTPDARLSEGDDLLRGGGSGTDARRSRTR